MRSSPVLLYTGRIQPLPGSGRDTGMLKTPIDSPIAIGEEGLAGDQQADRRVHGGPDKAVHLYPAEHYARLAARFPEAASQLMPGTIGENLSCTGLTEDDIHLGDVFQLGSARLQLSQPRSPCWKIDTRYDCEGMAAYIADTGLTGWYWRVLTPGIAARGDALNLVERHQGTPTLAAAMALLRTHRPSPDALAAIAAAPGVASGWRSKIEQRVQWLRRYA